MATLVFTIEQPSPSLQERKGALMAAIEERMGTLGEQLYQLVIGNVSGGILKEQTGDLAAAVVKSAVETTGLTSSVWVEIPQDNYAIWEYAIVLEKGGLKPYDIVPLESRFAALLGSSGGTGKESVYSGEGSIALKEGRLPHALMWLFGGTPMFAKIVHHEPSKAFAYMATSLEQVSDIALAGLQETVNTILEAA